MTKQKRIGVIGGTFDPIHIGHINLALELFEKRHLDEVIFCPAALSPLKMHQAPQVAAHHRFEMVKLAISKLSFFKITDVEIYRKEPCYTIDTLYMLKAQYQNQDEFFLLLGEDVIKDFNKWKSYEELIQLAHPLIGTRIGYDRDISALSPDAQEIFKKGFTPIHHLNVSSTYLRDRLSKGLYVDHLLPGNVVDYIHKNQLYLGS